MYTYNIPLHKGKSTSRRRLCLTAVHYNSKHRSIEQRDMIQERHKFITIMTNRHRWGGQPKNRFTKLAEENRLNHLKAVYERMERAFLLEDFPTGRKDLGGQTGPYVQPVLLASPSHVELASDHDCLGLLKEHCSSSSGAEKQKLWRGRKKTKRT